MGEAALVERGRVDEVETLAILLERSELRPRALIYSYFPDADDWKLRVLPKSAGTDVRLIYRDVARLIASNRATLPNIEVSDVEIAQDGDPQISALAQVAHVDGTSQIRLSKSMLKGIYIADVVIFRLAL